MKINTAIIIEDEITASERLKKLLINNDIKVLAILQSVKKANEWIENNTLPDYIFSDIQLTDGNSFEIFQNRKLNTKIVFTTAYNEFAIKAFEVNSIAFLLKPIKEEDLQKVLISVEYFATIFENDIVKNDSFETDFLVSFGSKLKRINDVDIICFFSEKNATYLKSNDNVNYPLTKSLDKLETSINPDIFFRINRSHILNKKYIQLISNKNVILNSTFIINDSKISRSRYSNFKKWYKLLNLKME